MWYFSAAYKHSLGSLGTLGGNFFYLDLGTGSSDYVLDATYGIKVNKNLAIGFGLKFIHFTSSSFFTESINTSNTIAADLGVLYKIHRLNDFSLGANFSNMGPKTHDSKGTNSDELPLPTHLKFGFAYNALNSTYNTIIIAFDFNKLLVNQSDNGNFDPWYEALFSSWDNGFKDVTFGYGIEYLYGNMFAVRAGYVYDDEGKSYYNNWGIGVKYSYFDFGFSFINAGEQHPLDETLRFSLKIRAPDAPNSLSNKKSLDYSSDFNRAISSNISFWSPWIEHENKTYIPSISFGASFLYRTTKKFLWEFGVLYSPLSVSEKYIDEISNLPYSDISYSTFFSSSLTKIMAGTRYFFPDKLKNTAYLSFAGAVYMFGDISVNWQSSQAEGEIKIEPKDKTVFGIQFGPGTMIQKSSKIAFDLRANFHILFGQNDTSYWFEPNVALTYLF